MEVYLNFLGIDDDIKSDIKKAKNKLESASSIASSVKIPSDFDNSSAITNLPSKVSNIKQQLTQFKDWLDISANKFQNAESQNISIIDSLIIDIESATNKLENSARYQSVNEKMNDAINILYMRGLITSEEKAKYSRNDINI